MKAKKLPFLLSVIVSTLSPLVAVGKPSLHSSVTAKNRPLLSITQNKLEKLNWKKKVFRSKTPLRAKLDNGQYIQGSIQIYLYPSSGADELIPGLDFRPDIYGSIVFVADVSSPSWSDDTLIALSSPRSGTTEGQVVFKRYAYDQSMEFFNIYNCIGDIYDACEGSDLTLVAQDNFGRLSLEGYPGFKIEAFQEDLYGRTLWTNYFYGVTFEEITDQTGSL